MENIMEKEFLDMALICVKDHKYGAAAEKLSKTDETRLQHECERLEELLGNHTNIFAGAIGTVIDNYEERIINDLSQKIHDIEQELDEEKE